MSGHSKWATIKRKKGAIDAKRSTMFAKLLRAVEVAAREGGSGDPKANMTLASAIEKARSFSVPNDNIDRAIKRGTGEDGGSVRFEEVVYEGYAPGGIALVVEALTDNRNRTGAEVKNVFTRNGGSLAEPGAVSWQFERKGVIITGAGASEDDVMLAALDAGAEDIAEQGGTFTITTAPSDVLSIRAALEEAGVPIESADTTMVASTSIELADEGSAKQVLRVIDALEDHDDVQGVYANFDIPETVLEAVMG